MRILQIMAGAEKGGAEKFFDRLAPALSKRGLNQHIICRDHPRRVNQLLLHNIPVTKAPFGKLLDFKTKSIIKETVHNFNPDIILTWMSRASDYCPQGDFITVARLGGYYDLKYYKNCDYLVGITHDIIQYFLKESWPDNKTAYLPNFVDPPSEDPPLDRSIHSTPNEAPLLLSLGRFHDDKAFDILIPALSYLPGVYLWLAGEGEREKRLKYLAQQYSVYERIRFLPWQTDISPLYKAADIYVCPSRFEPFGNVVVEGWAHEKPVVAAASAGPKSVITNNVNGLIVPLDDIQALAVAIKKLLDSKNLSQNLASEGYKAYLKNYTEKSVCDNYISFFQKIYNDKKRH